MIIWRNEKSGTFTAYHKIDGCPCLAEMPTRLDAIIECVTLIKQVQARKANEMATEAFVA